MTYKKLPVTMKTWMQFNVRELAGEEGGGGGGHQLRRLSI